MIVGIKGKIWIIDFKIKIGMVCYTIKMKNNKNSFTKKTEFKYYKNSS